MKVVEPEDTQVLVPVRMLKEKQGFRALLPNTEDGYGYYVKCEPNANFLHIALKDRGVVFNSCMADGYVLIFNVRENRLGTVKSDAMVEPIDMTVNTERK